MPDVAARRAKVFALDLGALRRRHALSRRLRGARQAGARSRSRRKTNAILFIDEIHTLVGAGAASGGAMDAGNLLKPALASGTLRCIGSTTFNDVKQSFDQDRALSRRFQKIEVLEPSEAETLEILKGLRPHYEAHHGVQLHRRGARGGGARCRRGTCKDLHLPDKAIDVLDEAGAAQKLLPAERARRPSIGAGADRADRREDGARAGAGGVERRQARARRRSTSS